MQPRILMCIFCLQSLLAFGQWSLNQDVAGKAKVANFSKINSECNDFCPTFNNDELIFVSGCNDKGKKQNNFDLVKVNLANLQRTAMSNLANSSYHEGPAELYQNGLYFTRSTTLDKINMLHLTGGKLIELNMDSTFVFLHPSLGNKGKTMMVSGKPKGDLTTKTDIFVLNQNINGFALKNQEIVNDVNSTSNDCFPRMVGDSILIFASDRPGGFGGMDLYVSFFVKDKWTKPVHLPRPINSEGDDFGLDLNDSFKKGFFNSNRNGGKGGDDIYTFKSEKPIFEFEREVTDLAFDIEVLDILTFVPIENTLVKILPIEQDSAINYLTQQNLDLVNTSEELVLYNIIDQHRTNALLFRTDSLGIIKANLSKSKGYFLEAVAPNYQLQYLVHVPNMEDTIQEIVMVLSPISIAMDTVPRPIMKGQRMIIEGLSFEGNKLKIEAFAEDFLEDLAKAMKAYPTMLIQLAAFTDVRGNAVNNFRNSQARAENLKKYLISLGIESDRIIAIGEGENKIINQCIEGVECTEQQHQVNNRIEIYGISD